MKEGRKTILAVALIVLSSLLVEAGVFYLMMKSDYFVGPQGPAGFKGDTGYQGTQGIQGMPGLNGKDGAKGSKGDTGPRGSSGSQGPAGEDAPINKLPMVLNAIQTGYYFEGPHHKKWFVFNITVNISDIDDDVIYLQFNHRENKSDPWIEDTAYIITNGSGTYKDSIRFGHCFPSGNKTIYWGISLWDGSDIVFEEYEYTVYAVYPIV